MKRGVSEALILSACLWLAAAFPVSADEERIHVEGLFDAENWNSNGASRLLSVNGDHDAGLGRVRLFVVGEFRDGFQGFLSGRAEGGAATGDDESESEIEQALLRYTWPGRRLAIEGGKLLTPVGDFPRRYLSSRNPLIGAPGGYGVDYPYGVRLSGGVGMFDYTAAVIDKPIVNESWVPPADSSPRPAVALGITPTVGLRVGAFATEGPYLGRDTEPFLSAGEHWRDYRQVLYGLDLQFSRGYFELNGQLDRSLYEVPGLPDTRGLAWYLEPKYTFTPRLFAALRYERNEYAFVRPLSPGSWIGRPATYAALEAGVGYRFLPRLIVKASWRRDHWYEQDSAFFPDGSVLAVQVSYGFDVSSWFREPL